MTLKTLWSYSVKLQFICERLDFWHRGERIRQNMKWTTRYHETTKYIHMYWNEEPQGRLRNWGKKIKIYCMQQPWRAAF